ncbi:phosphopantothenoylcysteine decarboxylase subunit SIS2-like [Vicia villosa]|uniref:phosphopantothenoylcysteine decarboxylase subunit SIS2-like n=1 Tax=Vicia villosa TaxID=3911 RepID=UPI00273C78D8|nr:phosphopantothenoylcysteine decarboxylase subunit SIS2-like [Vicia villosa]
MGCPHCMEHTKAFTLDKGMKSSWFDCHRRFLPRNHTYRKNKTDFKKDEVVRDHPPPRLSPGGVWEQVCVLPKFTDIEQDDNEDDIDEEHDDNEDDIDEEHDDNDNDNENDIDEEHDDNDNDVKCVPGLRRLKVDVRG